MLSIHALLHEHDGVIATNELHAGGFGRGAIRGLLQRRRLIRVRQGWYAAPDTDPDLLAAFRIGGSLGGVSALATLGCWLPPASGFHVTVPAGSSRLRTPTDASRRLAEHPNPRVILHWHAAPPVQETRMRTGLADLLRELIRCQPIEYVIAVADSALARQDHRAPLLRLDDWTRIAEEFPRLLPQLRRVDPQSGAGTESITRFRCWRDHRLAMRSQVWIPGVGWVDFLIGERLAIEVDGAAYHTDPEQFEADRRRDAVLSALGFRVLRFSYRQVMERWDEVERAILAAIVRGDHL